MYIEKQFREGTKGYAESEVEVAQFEARPFYAWKKKGIELTFRARDPDVHFGICMSTEDTDTLIEALTAVSNSLKKEIANGST